MVDYKYIDDKVEESHPILEFIGVLGVLFVFAALAFLPNLRACLPALRTWLGV